MCSFVTVLNTTLEILRFLTLSNDRMFPFSCLKVNSGILELEIYQLLIAVVLRTTNAIAGSLRTARGLHATFPRLSIKESPERWSKSAYLKTSDSIPIVSHRNLSI